MSVSSALALVLLATAGDISAHGGGNWNAFRIDGVNNNARRQVLTIQNEMAQIIRGRSDAGEWPIGALRATRDASITVKEEVDEVLEHYVIDGVNIQVFTVLQAEPRAGRTVAASRALGAGIALIEHAASLESAEEFIADFYAGGLTSRLYELLEAHGERMDLYELLTTAEE